MPKTVMILEDNPDTLRYLGSMVKRISPEIEVLMFSSMEGVFDAAMNSRIDLFLVDIILDQSSGSGDTSGLGFVEKIRGVQKYEFTPVIFITSLQDPKFYAYNNLQSFRFIEKPIDTDEVEKTIRKALRYSDNSLYDPTIFFRRDGIIIRVQSSEILYVESNLHKLYVHLTNGCEEVIPYKTCKWIMNEVGEDIFLQCSRNAIVNRHYIDNVDLVNRYIQLKPTGDLVEIGVTYCEKLEKEFGNVR